MRKNFNINLYDILKISCLSFQLIVFFVLDKLSVEKQIQKVEWSILISFTL
jgi:hypothetical protein